LENIYIAQGVKYGGGRSEVTLDIELMIATAPAVTKIQIYLSPNTNALSLQMLYQIAEDNTAKSISTSWGIDENQISAAYKNSENQAFQQMAAGGQSFFAAAGDDGAFDAGTRALLVDDPASQPFVTGAGGTTLKLTPTGTYESETTWWTPDNRWGGGGGISLYWPLPSYQSGVLGAGSKGSQTFRNVPDVAMNANPSTGYPIYLTGRWYVYGGTSCAAPIWAAFMGIVNQYRSANNFSTIGFANPKLYAVGMSANYNSAFHDITVGTNGYYHAVTGYDLATGWGSMIGQELLLLLSSKK